jgi:probable F420-dependent oxidoreductase
VLEVVIDAKEARVLIGCHLPTTLAPGATKDGLVTFAREAERRDVASLWVSDHVVIPRVTSGHRSGGAFPHPPDRPYLEPVTALTAAALCTTRPRLGSSVFILGHRHPVVMAKMLASIDALSEGRLVVGVGVGWWKEELEVLGLPFAARGRHATETLRIFKALWTAENPSFEGEFFRFRDIGFAPKPVQKPHPPIWVGGGSPGAFRRVAALGDGWHANARTPAQFRDHLGQLWAAADAAGRPHESIELSLRYGLRDDVLTGGAQSVVDDLAAFKRLGVGHVLIEFRRPDLARMLDLLDVVTGTIRPAVDAA